VTPDLLIAAALLLPACAIFAIAAAGRTPNLREAITLAVAAALLASVAPLLGEVESGGRPELHLLTVVPGLDFALRVEPLGMMFALVASSLWILNSLYSIGYMRTNREPRQTLFYCCFAAAIASTIGIAFAANLFTLFVFYELLTLTTYPLVAHRADRDAVRAGRLYLLLLLGTSIVLLLPAIIWTWAIAGTLEFTPGGLLAGRADALETGLLLALFALGIGKAALMPFHRWLPAAMVAPTPVSALLHAVAVVKAGVFTVLKVVVYVFGPAHLLETGASQWLVWVASFTLVAASVVALTRENLKVRLAYSTVSQLSYVVLGAALASPLALAGAAMHIVMHAAGKITLFFCAGAIYTASHKTEVRQLDGIGKTMPFTMAAFFVGALSVAGLPPLGGMWSKLMLALGAFDVASWIAVAALMLSTVLNVAYLMPIVLRAFFRAPVADDHGGGEHGDAAHGQAGVREAPWQCVVPLCLTAAMCVALFFLADRVEALVTAALVVPG